MNAPKYPVMVCIARDILAIQASTVVSESAFSTGGIVINDHRTRLKSDTVEAVICLQDWLKSADYNPSEPVSTTKIDDEDCLVFYQGSKYNEENNIAGLSESKVGAEDDEDALLI